MVGQWFCRTCSEKKEGTGHTGCPHVATLQSGRVGDGSRRQRCAPSSEAGPPRPRAGGVCRHVQRPRSRHTVRKLSSCVEPTCGHQSTVPPHLLFPVIPDQVPDVGCKELPEDPGPGARAPSLPRHVCCAPGRSPACGASCVAEPSCCGLVRWPGTRPRFDGQSIVPRADPSWAVTFVGSPVFVRFSNNQRPLFQNILRLWHSLGARSPLS